MLGVFFFVGSEIEVSVIHSQGDCSNLLADFSIRNVVLDSE